jgi:hypothetical protein
MESKATPSRRRPLLRKLSRAAGLLLLALGLLLFFLPSLLSTGPGRDRLIAYLQERLEAPVEASALELSWWGPQRLEGLRLGQPRGFPAREDLLRARGAVLKGGLLHLLLPGESALELELEEPVLNVRRNSEGRFNLLAVVKEEDQEAAGEPEEGEEPAAESGGSRGGRRISLTVKNGSIHYRDDVLETGSDLSPLDLSIRLDPGEARLAGDGVVVQKGGEPGRLKIDATAGGLSPTIPLRDASLNATVQVRGVDLRPYRGFLEKHLKVEPPEEPVEGELNLIARDGILEIQGGLDAGYASLEELDCRVPLEEGKEAGSLRAICSIQLPRALDSLSAYLRLPEGFNPSGTVKGNISASALPSPLKLAGGDLLNQLEVRGQLEISGPLEYRGFSVSKVSSGILVRGGRIEFPGAAGSVNGGQVSASELSLKLARPLEYRVALEARGVEANIDMTPVLAYVIPFLAPGDRKARLTGRIQSTLDIRGKEGIPEGSGSLQIRDGRLGASVFLEELARHVGMDPGEVLFQEMGSRFEIRREEIAAERIYLTAREGSKTRNLGLKGVTRLDGSIDYGIDLSSLEETIGDKKIRGIIGVARGILNDDAFPLRMRGTLWDPRISIVPGAGGLKLEGILPGKTPAPEIKVKDILEIFKK